MPIRITGLNSGLDTESIISALVSSYNYKTEKYKKAQTKLSWTQDAWKSLNTKIYSLYTSVGNLRFSGAYNMKSTSVSDSTKVSVTAGSNAVNGSYSVQVTSLAKSGYLTGGKLASGTTASTKLSDLTVKGNEKFSGEGTFSVTAGGKTVDITVNSDTKIQDVIDKMKEAGVNANYDASNHRIYVSAKDTGEENDFSLTASDANGIKALAALGLNAAPDSVAVNANMAEYQALAAYADLANGADLSTDEGKAALKAAIEEIIGKKEAATADNKTKQTENANYQKAIDYAKASEAVKNVATADGVTGTPEEFELLKKLATEDLKNKHVGSDGKIYTYTVATNSFTTKLEDGTIETKPEDVTTKDASEVYEQLAKDFGLVVTEQKDGKDVENREALNTFKSNVETVNRITKEAEADAALGTLLTEADQTAATADKTPAEVFEEKYQTIIENNKTAIAANNATLAANEKIVSGMDVDVFVDKVHYAEQVLADNTLLSEYYNADANRISGTSAAMWVNGVRYTGESNIFSINGMTFTATGVTSTEQLDQNGDYKLTDPNSGVNVTVNTDAQGIYDKIKDFLSQYNKLINEMSALYNADAAKGYEPLTDEERDAMSDTEVEKWEAKIKDSLLRRDNTLSGIMNVMTNAMSKGVVIGADENGNGGKTYYLSSFGIKTLGYLNAVKNERNAYHIDGDADDISTSGNEDKLMKAITEDPDTVLEFMQGLASNLYKAVDSKMKATTLSSTYTVYNDKEMASEYSDYTSLITKWQERLEQQEEYYYNKFAAMETALAKLNSQTSSLNGLFGM